VVVEMVVEVFVDIVEEETFSNIYSKSCLLYVFSRNLAGIGCTREIKHQNCSCNVVGRYG
jgi:hypothetical protein